MHEFKNFLKKIINRIRGEINTEKYIACGMKIGKNFKRLQGCSFDISHCWLIEIGDNVTTAPNVKLIAHDASTINDIGYAVIGPIIIGNNCFIGAGSTILPNVKIGNNVIIGAASVVTKNIPANTVFAGNPARKICNYDEYIDKRKKQMNDCPIFGEEYTVRGKIGIDKKHKMKKSLNDTVGFVK